MEEPSGDHCWSLTVKFPSVNRFFSLVSTSIVQRCENVKSESTTMASNLSFLRFSRSDLSFGVSRVTKEMSLPSCDHWNEIGKASCRERGMKWRMAV